MTTPATPTLGLALGFLASAGGGPDRRVTGADCAVAEHRAPGLRAPR